MARGLVEETVLVELQGQVELPTREGASATASRREESPSACDEVSATLGEDPERNRNRPGGLTSHTIQRPEFAREKTSDRCDRILGIYSFGSLDSVPK